MVTASVGTPAGSPFTCSTSSTGMQVLNGTAGEVVAPTVATTAVMPGTRAVANPFASTGATVATDDDHEKLPTWLVISVALWNAWATNWCVCAMEKHPETGSTVTEVTEGWTETLTGPLLTPCAVAVMVAVPVTGFPNESRPLQTTKVESQTPPHTLPDGEMVAILVFDELKVKVAVTVLLLELTANALIDVTCPATREIEVGLTVTAATLLFEDEEPPPQPVSNDKNSPKAASVAAGPTDRRQRAPFARVFRTS
jgi:hypothetical protein